MPPNYGGGGQLPQGGSYVTFVDSTGFSNQVRQQATEKFNSCQRTKPTSSPTECLTVNEHIKQLHQEYFRSGNAFRPTGSSTGPYDWSIVLETQTTLHSQCIRSNPRQPWTIADEQNITFTLSNDFVIPDTVIVWKSVFYTSSNEPTIVWFERQNDLPVNKATNSFTLYGIHPDSVYSLTSMDRGQSHGNPSPPPPNTPFPGTAPGAATPPYVETFQNYPVESMPNYFSDHCGSFAVMPRRDNESSLAYEQEIVALPIAWGGDSLYPFTIIGDWNTTDQDVQVDTYIYSYSDLPAPGDPLVSAVPCDATDPGQVWYFNLSTSFTLPNSLVDNQLHQCFDVFGCNPDPGTPVWMWPCVNAPGSNCNSDNQLWTYNPTNGYLVSQMTTGYCVTITSSGAVVMYSCGNSSLSSNDYQTFQYDGSTGLLQLMTNGGNKNPTGRCLCSRPPPPSVTDDSTHIGIGLRLGGMTNTSSVAQAYATTWYNYGYWFSVRPDGTWTITRGTTPPKGTLTDEETQEMYIQRKQLRSRSRRRTQRDDQPHQTILYDSRAVLANGTLPNGTMGLQQWHTLRFTAIGTTLTASFDGNRLTTVQDNYYPVGWSGLSTGWHIAQFKEFILANGQNRIMDE